MTSEKFFGLVALVVMLASAIPYLVGIWRRKFHPALISWILWTLIGFVMLLALKATGATDNIWVGVTAFLNPLAVVIVILIRQREWKKPEHPVADALAAVVCVVALVIYCTSNGDVEKVLIALIASIVADVCAAIPTVRLAWTEPAEEQPIPWLIYGVGVLISLLSIHMWQFDQLVLPLYGLLLATAILVPTMLFRIKKQIPFFQWM